MMLMNMGVATLQCHGPIDSIMVYISTEGFNGFYFSFISFRGCPDTKHHCSSRQFQSISETTNDPTVAADKASDRAGKCWKLVW